MDNGNKTETARPSRRDRSGRSRFKKMMGRIVLFGSAAIILLILAGYAILRVPYIQHRIKTLAIETLEREWGITLELGEISGNILSKLTIEKVRLGDPTGTILSADRILVGYQLPMLLRRMVVITRLRIEGLGLNLTRNSTGNWNIAELFRSEKPAAEEPQTGTPFKILFKGLSVADGTVKIDDSGMQRQFNDIALEIALEAAQVLKADVKHLAFRLDHPRLTLTSLKGHINYDEADEHLTIEGVNIETELSRLSVDAQLQQNGPEPEITLDVNAKAFSLAELGHLLSVSTLNSGSLAGNIHLQGTPSQLQHRLKLGLEGQSLTAEGILTGMGGPGMGVETKGAIRNLNPAAWPLDSMAAWDGDINADFSLVGKNLDMPERQGQLNVQLMASGLAGYRVEKGVFDLTADNGTLAISEVHLTGPGGSVRLEGRLEGISETAAGLKAVIDGEIRNIDTDTLFPDLKMGGMINIDLHADAAGRLSASGRFDPAGWTGNADLRLLPSALLAKEVHGGNLQAGWNGKTLQLKALNLQSAVGHAALQGRATFQPLIYKVGGKIAVEKLKETVLLLGDLVPRIPEDKLPDGRLDINGTWDGKLLQVEVFDLQTDAGHAVLKGHVSPEPLDYQIDGEVAVAELKKIVPLLSDLAPQLPVKQLPNGRFQIKGAARGNNDRADIRATLNVEDLTHDDVTVASARLDGDWHISGTDVTGRTEGYVTDIVYEETLFPRLDINVQVSPADVTADLKLAKDTGEQLQLAGQVAQWQQENRRIRIDTLKVTGITDPLSRLITEISNPEPIKIETHPDSIDIDVFKLVAGPMLFRADGRLSREGSQGLQLSLTGLDLNQLAALWQEEPALQGMLTAEVALGGTGESPTIDAQVTVKDASGYEVSLSDLDLRLTYRDRTASLTAGGFLKGRKIFNIEGQSGLTLRLLPFELTPVPGSLQAELVANDLKLSELPNPLQRKVAIDGLVALQLLATGDLQQPQLTGFLTLQEGSLALPRHNLTYESVQANLSLLPGKLTIDKIELRGDREGALNLTGDILLTGFAPTALNLHLTGNQAPIAWRREITARINPDISLTGELSSPVLSGRLRIPEGRINLDRMMAGGPADIQVLGEQSGKDQTIVISEPQEDDFLSSLTAELTIEVPGNVWLRGQDLNAEIAGTIKLNKKPNGPFLLVGALNTVRGNYLFQNRRFEIVRGRVDFQGLEEPDPELDIRAEAKIRDATIIVRITGSARMIELALESEPMMDQADIVSYLVFGRPNNELRSEQATDAQVAALNLAGRAAARELKSILGDTLAVDEIRIDPGEEDWRSGALTLGKYVTRNIFMTYRMGFSASDFGSVGIEYELNRNFSIEAEVGNERSSGVDVIWKTDF